MAIGQTVVQYGSWVLYRCETLEFHQKPAYDDVSQTDLMYHRFTLKVRGYVKGLNTYSSGICVTHSPVTGDDGINGSMASSSLNMIGMRVNLPPRQFFMYRIGADSSGSSGGYLALYAEACPSPPPANMTHVDVNNGPRCNSFVVTRVVSDNVFQVEAEFEVCKIECSASANAAPPSGIAMRTAGIATGNTKGVLSNRWSVVDQIDANLKTVRTYHGRLRVASNNIDPNDFRYYVVPPLQPGLRRDQISFSVSPDGMNLDYMIRDVEVIDSAPSPAKRWTIQHSEVADQAMQVHASCEVTLTADRGTSKGDLIIIGMNVLLAKLLNGNVNPGDTVFLESIGVTDFIGDDLVISTFGKVRRLPKKPEDGNEVDPFAPWFVGNSIIGKPLSKNDVYFNPLDQGVKDDSYDGTRSYGGLVASAGLPGSSPYYEGPVQLIGAFLPYLQTPCNDVHKIVPDGMSVASDENSSPTGGYAATVTAAVDPNWTDSDQPLFSTSQKTSMYTNWKMESIYKENEMVAAMPVAKNDYSTGDSTAFVTICDPQARRIVRIEAERIGSEPEMPSGSQLAAIPFDTSGTSLSSGMPGLTFRFLRKVTRYATPFYTAGGQKAWRVAADYFFGLNRRPTSDEKLPVGRNIWTVDGNLNTTTLATKGWSP